MAPLNTGAGDRQAKRQSRGEEPGGKLRDSIIREQEAWAFQTDKKHGAEWVGNVSVLSGKAIDKTGEQPLVPRRSPIRRTSGMWSLFVGC